MSTENLKPLLPLRDIVIFPSTVIPLFVGRKKSIKALEEVMKTDKDKASIGAENPINLYLKFCCSYKESLDI